MTRFLFGPIALALAVLLGPVGCGQTVTESESASSERSRESERLRESESTKSIAAIKSAVLERLTDIGSPTNRQWILGQNVGHTEYFDDGYRDHISALNIQTSRFPGMLGVDLGYDTPPAIGRESIRRLAAFARQGGLVSVSMHPPSPWGGDLRTTPTADDWDELFRDGSVANRRWQTLLRQTADCLQRLRNANVVVLWRPLHEMNGGWFWWCRRDDQDRWTSRDHFVKLWKQMHHYMVSDRGLDHLIWVYSAAVQTDAGQRAANVYYPGDAWADVVGLDWYSDDLSDIDRLGSYTQLLRFNKPFAITEFGPQSRRDGSFDNQRLFDVAASLPRLSYVMYWHSWPGAKVAIVDQRNVSKLMVAPEVLTLDRLRATSNQETIGKSN